MPSTKESEAPAGSALTAPRSQKSWWTEGILVAAASAYAYAAAFAYEAGGAVYFRVPYQLVSVDLIQAFVAGLVLYLSLAWVVMALNVASPLWHRAPKAIRGNLTTAAIYSLLILVPVAILGDYTYWWAVLMMVALVLSGEFLLPVFTQKDTRGYVNKLVAAAEAETRQTTSESPSFLRSLVVRSPRVALSAVLAVSILGAAYLAGLGQARRQEDFLTWPGSPDRAAVFVSTSRMVFADLDRPNHATGTQLTVVEVPASNERTLTLEHVGPLHPSKP